MGLVSVMALAICSPTGFLSTWPGSHTDSFSTYKPLFPGKWWPASNSSDSYASSALFKQESSPLSFACSMRANYCASGEGKSSSLPSLLCYHLYLFTNNYLIHYFKVVIFPFLLNISWEKNRPACAKPGLKYCPVWSFLIAF